MSDSDSEPWKVNTMEKIDSMRKWIIELDMIKDTMSPEEKEKYNNMKAEIIFM